MGSSIYDTNGGEERNNLGDLDVDVRIILKWIFKKWVGGYSLD